MEEYIHTGKRLTETQLQLVKEQSLADMSAQLSFNLWDLRSHTYMDSHESKRMLHTVITEKLTGGTSTSQFAQEGGDLTRQVVDYMAEHVRYGAIFASRIGAALNVIDSGIQDPAKITTALGGAFGRR